MNAFTFTVGIAEEVTFGLVSGAQQQAAVMSLHRRMAEALGC
jgi:hypothetical protein